MRLHPITNKVLILGLASLVMPACYAQVSTVTQFLDRASQHPVGGEVERDQFLRQVDSLATTSRSNVEEILPGLLRYTDLGKEPNARTYAALFLAIVAQRSDGGDLLASHSAEVASLLTDSNPVIQRAAVTITDYVIGKNSENYIPALIAALQSTSTSQDIAAEMTVPLLRYGSDNPAAVGAIHAFLTRPDLTSDAKIATIHSLGGFSHVPEEINTDLCDLFGDSDPRVRAAAIVSFGNSKPTANFHTKALPLVQRIAADENEKAQVRQLAKDALAGRSPLNPNVDGGETPVVPPR